MDHKANNAVCLVHQCSIRVLDTHHLRTSFADDALDEIAGLFKMVAYRVPFEVYGRYPQEFYAYSRVENVFGVDVVPICHGTLGCIENCCHAHATKLANA